MSQTIHTHELELLEPLGPEYKRKREGNQIWHYKKINKTQKKAMKEERWNKKNLSSYAENNEQNDNSIYLSILL